MTTLESWLAEVEARTVAAQPDADTPWGRWAAESSGPHDRGEWWVLADDGDALAMVDGHLAFGIDPAALAAFYAGAHADVPKLCSKLRSAHEPSCCYWAAGDRAACCCAHVVALRQEVARLRDALGFYADPDSWTCGPTTPRVLDVLRLADVSKVKGVVLGTRPVLVGGLKARAALEETP